MEEKLQLLRGDITQLAVDAIVNAANAALESGAGVSGAIHHQAGPALQEACRTLGGCAVGQAKITPGFALPARYIIHTVGPVWRGGNKGESKLLASCYYESLKLAFEQGATEIAFPAISCGIFGYPASQAAIIAIKESANFIELHPEMKKVYFVCYEESTYEAYQQVLSIYCHE
jgi:O-acetyl-ADP-ribose deacetylase (regulator of RNase III)